MKQDDTPRVAAGHYLKYVMEKICIRWRNSQLVTNDQVNHSWRLLEQKTEEVSSKINDYLKIISL
jgi:hypothetical protein